MAKVVSIRPVRPIDADPCQLSLYLLLRLYKAIAREGWEKGPNENEVREAVMHHLHNQGIFPFNERGDANKDMLILTDRLMEQFDPMYGW